MLDFVLPFGALQHVCVCAYDDLTHVPWPLLKLITTLAKLPEECCTMSAGKKSSEPASRWKRMLVGALFVGSVAAAGMSCCT